MNFDHPKWANNVKFAVYMLEQGSSGTPHYQGYLELHNPQRMSWLKKRQKEIHWERRRGPRGKAIKYCLKDYIQKKNQEVEEGKDLNDMDLPPVYLHGYDQGVENLITNCEPKNVSLKERMLEVKELISSGASEKHISDLHFDIWCRYHRSFTRYKALITPDRNFPTYYIVCQGATGTGKSKYAMETYPDAYWKSKDEWWDGYSGQDAVILDEFYGWLPWDLLLRLGDRYPLQTQTKGSIVKFKSQYVVITTNSVPTQWYKNTYFPAFARRVKEWIIFKEDGREHYTDYKDVENKFIICI